MSFPTINAQIPSHMSNTLHRGENTIRFFDQPAIGHEKLIAVPIKSKYHEQQLGDGAEFSTIVFTLESNRISVSRVVIAPIYSASPQNAHSTIAQSIFEKFKSYAENGFSGS